MKTGVIAEVSYKREIKHAGRDGLGVDFMENDVTFEDGSKELRLGIARVHGKNIKEMTNSLVNAVHELNGWWSLQTTSLTELKAAHRAGFRNRELSSMEEHLKEFENQCGTLHVERIEG